MDTKDKDNMAVRTLNAELHSALEGAIAQLEAYESLRLDFLAWDAEFMAALPAYEDRG